jgi:hypothetical protein
MAAATTFSAGKFLLLVSDGGGTPVFAEPCAILEASMTINKELADTLIPDCDNPDLVGWIDRDAQSNSMSVKFSGLATGAGVRALDAIALSETSRAMRLQLVGAGSGGGTPDYRWSGNFHITSLELGRTRGEKISFSAEMMSDGAITSASVAALS